MDMPPALFLADAIAPLLPRLPSEDDDGLTPEGRNWIEQLLHTEWTPIRQWGADPEPWDTWPDEALAHHDGRELFGLAVHTPGLTTVHGYRSRTARDADTTAVHRQWVRTAPTD